MSKPQVEVAKKEVPKTHTLFVYGTLKKGFYNNDYWFTKSKLIGTDTLGGFVMINLGPYPAIAKISTPSAVDYFGVTGELWEVPEDEYIPVKQMEEGAGYQIIEAVTDGGVRVEAFIQHEFQEGDYSWTAAEVPQDKKLKKRDTVTVAPRLNLPF